MRKLGKAEFWGGEVIPPNGLDLEGPARLERLEERYGLAMS